MTASVRKISVVALACLVCASLRCISLQATGGTGDETVIGKLVNEDGSPAGPTEVTVRSSSFDPTSGQHYGADTTDSQGRYTITIPSSVTKRYTLQAVSLSLRTRTIIPDVEMSGPGSTTAIGASVLHKIGRIKVILSDSSMSGNGYIYIPGTSYNAYLENGFALIDSVPAEIIPHVYYNGIDDITPPQSLADSVEVKPGITTIVAFSGWAHAKKISLNTTSTGADVAGNVYGFPLLIRLSADNFSFSGSRTDGSDLRFTKPDNTPLPFEIERWDAAARLAEIWVKLDTVYGNDSSHFVVMYWGEPATAIPLNRAQVFDTTNGFRGVWHLGEEAAGVGAKGLYKDATGRNNGDDFISATDRSGIIGCGHAFDGIDDYIPVNGPVTNFIKGDLTISLWVNIHDSGGTIVSKLDSTLRWFRGDECFYLGDGTDTRDFPGVNGSYPSFVEYTNSYALSGRPVPSDGWHHLAYSWKWNGDSTGISQCFIDGMEAPLSKDSLIVRIDENINATLRIGQPNNNESRSFFKGLMDELEISAVVRSADWIKLSYMNQRKENSLVK